MRVKTAGGLIGFAICEYADIGKTALEPGSLIDGRIRSSASHHFFGYANRHLLLFAARPAHHRAPGRMRECSDGRPGEAGGCLRVYSILLVSEATHDSSHGGETLRLNVARRPSRIQPECRGDLEQQTFALRHCERRKAS
jgi:hypothetical protein